MSKEESSRGRPLAKARRKGSRSHGSGHEIADTQILHITLPDSINFEPTVRQATETCKTSGAKMSRAGYAGFRGPANRGSGDDNEDVNDDDNEREDVSDQETAQASDQIIKVSGRKLRPKSIQMAVTSGDFTLARQMMEEGKTDVNKFQVAIQGALMQALMTEDVKTLSSLLELGGEYITKAVLIGDIAFKAVDVNKEMVVHFFIANGADFNSNTVGSTVLHSVARSGNLSLMKRFLDFGETDINAKNKSDGATALHISVQLSRRECAMMLLERGASVNIKDSKGRLPLHYAAMHGDFTMVQAFISKQSAIAPCDENYVTPMLAAAQNNYSMLARFLAEKQGAKWLKENLPYNKTLLHSAAALHSIPCIKLLLDYGLDPSSIDDFGNTPLHEVVKIGGRSAASVIECLMENKKAKALINLCNADGLTPLHFSFANVSAHLESPHIGSWCRSTCEALLKAGSDINCLLPDGHSLLMRYIDNKDKAKFLLKHGADINIVSDSGDSALSMLISMVSDEGWSVVMTNMLLNKNIDVIKLDTISQCSGKSPVVLALAKQRNRIPQLLYMAGMSLQGLSVFMTTDQARDIHHHHSMLSVFLNSVNPDNTDVRGLREFSRFAILRQLGHSDIDSKIKTLPLPTKLKDYLKLETFMKIRAPLEDMFSKCQITSFGSTEFSD